jgi:hypothetical protein
MTMAVQSPVRVIVCDGGRHYAFVDPTVPACDDLAFGGYVRIGRREKH